MDNFIEDQRAVNVQANQEIETVESTLSTKLDGLDKKLDILQQSISHQEEEDLEEECLTETILGELAQLQLQEGLKEGPAEDPEVLQDAS